MCVSKCVYVFLCLHYKQYLRCWNGSTTSGGQALYSILSTVRKKKNPLGFIFPASAILLWCCSEICFHQADSIRELGNEKSAIEWCGRGGGRGLEGKREEIVKRKKVTLTPTHHIPPFFFTSSCFFTIPHFRNYLAGWKEVILFPQKPLCFF